MRKGLMSRLADTQRDAAYQNRLRKKTNPAMYPPDPSNALLSVDHLNHCIEQLQQCRKFDRIQSWAFNNVRLGPFGFNNEGYGE
ncbi:hypothetical protein PG999_014750 [Apiospora kogelbergensis]|uniref:Uncharacterized protein n=1 Tax=Apiospora kogelbergensis TaxID=1337665 RepID=A0AAW0QDF6_9PEZI